MATLVTDAAAYSLSGQAASLNKGFIVGVSDEPDVIQLDSSVIEPALLHANSINFYDDTYGVVAWQDGSTDGRLQTISVDSAGTITKIEQLEYATTDGRWPDVKWIDASHFVVAHENYPSKAQVRVFSVSGSYDTITELELLTHATNTNNDQNHLVFLDDTHFVITLVGDGTDGFVTSFKIDDSFTITQYHTLEFDTGYCQDPSVEKIDSSHFVIAYTTASTDGMIKTFSIDSENVISEIDSLEHDTVNGQYTTIRRINSEYFVMVFAGFAKGIAKIIKIDNTYNISVHATYEFYGLAVRFPDVTILDARRFVISYDLNTTTSHVKLLTIDANYENIEQLGSTPTISNWTSGARVHLDKLTIDRVALVIRSSSSTDGVVYTFDTTSGSMFSFGGEDVKLLYSKAIDAESGVYAVSGVDVVLRYTPILSAGTYSFSGKSIALPKGNYLETEPASYAISGQSTNLTRTLIEATTAANYSLSGAGVVLSRAIIFTTGAAEYSFTGQVAVLTYADPLDFPLVTEATSYGLVGASINLLTSFAVPIYGDSYATTEMRLKSYATTEIRLDSYCTTTINKKSYGSI